MWYWPTCGSNSVTNVGQCWHHLYRQIRLAHPSEPGCLEFSSYYIISGARSIKRWCRKSYFSFHSFIPFVALISFPLLSCILFPFLYLSSLPSFSSPCSSSSRRYVTFSVSSQLHIGFSVSVKIMGLLFKYRCFSCSIVIKMSKFLTWAIPIYILAPRFIESLCRPGTDNDTPASQMNLSITDELINHVRVEINVCYSPMNLTFFTRQKFQKTWHLYILNLSRAEFIMFVTLSLCHFHGNKM